jgi:hypothetical protein
VIRVTRELAHEPEGFFEIESRYMLPLGTGFSLPTEKKGSTAPVNSPFYKAVLPTSEKSVASSIQPNSIWWHTICIDGTTGTCLPRLNLRNITDHSHADGLASTTNNSPCTWLAIVSVRSKGSPRQKTPTQFRS